MTIDNGQLTIIGATNVVYLCPSVKVCRERPVCRSGNVANRTRADERNHPTVMHYVFDILQAQNNDRHVENTLIRNKCIVGAAICRPLRSEYNLCG